MGTARTEGRKRKRRAKRPKRPRRRTRGKATGGELPRPSRGGRRPGAGRPKTTDETVPHAKRPPHARRHPVHVTTRLQNGLPSLRRTAVLRALREALEAGRERDGFALDRFAVAGDRIDLLVAADDRYALSRGIQGLKVRIARTLNRLWSRHGPVFAERYDERALRTPRELQSALRDVFGDAGAAARPTSPRRARGSRAGRVSASA